MHCAQRRNGFTCDMLFALPRQRAAGNPCGEAIANAAVYSGPFTAARAQPSKSMLGLPVLLAETFTAATVHMLMLDHLYSVHTSLLPVDPSNWATYSDVPPPPHPHHHPSTPLGGFSCLGPNHCWANLGHRRHLKNFVDSHTPVESFVCPICFLTQNDENGCGNPRMLFAP